jgi:hypothetical protein
MHCRFTAWRHGVQVSELRDSSYEVFGFSVVVSGRLLRKFAGAILDVRGLEMIRDAVYH